MGTESFKKRELAGQWYFCDESTIPSMPLCYSKEIVLSEIENKIVKPLINNPPEKRPYDALRGKSERFERKIAARLGRAIKNEVERLVSDEQYWEALFSLHQILEHRLRKMFTYKSMDIDASKQEILFDEEKEAMCRQVEFFKPLADFAFLVGAIESDTREKLLDFNNKRNDIAHDFLKMDIPRKRLKKVCSIGLELMDILENQFSKIIPKPKFIIMPKFFIKSIDERT
jgi:hypothetical protein